MYSEIQNKDTPLEKTHSVCWEATEESRRAADTHMIADDRTVPATAKLTGKRYNLRVRPEKKEPHPYRQIVEKFLKKLFRFIV